MSNRLTMTESTSRPNREGGSRRYASMKLGLGALFLLMMSSTASADETMWTFTSYEDTYTTIASSEIQDVFTASARTPNGQRIAVGSTKNI